MIANPRFAVLMGLYARYDSLTLMLAGLALAAVLIGWAISRSGSGVGGRLISQVYFGLLIIGFVFILAGTYVLLLGGTS